MNKNIRIISFPIRATLTLGPALLTPVRRVQKSPLLEADVGALGKVLRVLQSWSEKISCQLVLLLLMW